MRKVTEQPLLNLKSLDTLNRCPIVCFQQSAVTVCVSTAQDTRCHWFTIFLTAPGAETSLAVCISSVRGSSTNQRTCRPQISEVVIMWNVLPQHVLSAVKCSTKSTCWRERRERGERAWEEEGKKKKWGEELNTGWQGYSLCSEAVDSVNAIHTQSKEQSKNSF